MSDHWNSIANLLKTPSLNPTAKKTDGPPKPTKSALPTEIPAAYEPAPVAVVEPVKSKPEPSRLRSSWDAVATFFGVAAPEQAPESQHTPAVSEMPQENQGFGQVAPGGKKTKPSMWGQPAEDSQSVAGAAKAEPRISSRTESAPESDQQRSSGESRDRGRSRGRAPVADNRSMNEDASFAGDLAPRSLPQSQRDEPFSPIDSERRSQRQQPRRGRQADVRADVAFGEPMAESNFADDLPLSNRSTEADPAPRPERAPRHDRGPRPERSGRDDRPSKPPRVEGDARGERPARPARDANPEPADVESRGERLPRPEGAARPARSESGDERPPRMDRGDRPARTDRDERPARAGRDDRPARTDRGDRPPRTEGGDRPPRTEGGDRPPRADRGDRPPRTESGDRQDRPARPERSERAARPERSEGAARSDGSARDERPARAEGGERRPSRDRPERTERPAAPRGNRDASADRRPNETIAKKPSGFGAGIQDDDAFGFVDAPYEPIDDFEQVDERNEGDSDVAVSRDSSERESRPRRRRGRGKRADSKGSEGQEAANDPRDAADDRDEEDSSDSITRDSRIPSWQDAIGTLVAVNMENHQRNQSQNRGPRCRGPRRDR